jgi:hypothetical protein
MSGLSAKVRVARRADRQAGQVSAAQLAALGVDTRVVSRWVSDGYLLCRHPRVYAVGHRAPSVEADLTAAVLYAGPGAMLSYATALWWRGVIDKQPRPLQVSTPRRCRSLRGVKVHGRRDCPRVWHKGLPTTTVEQALLDYATVAPLQRVRRALAVAEYLGLLDVTAMRESLGRGRRGSVRLGQALERHEPKLAHTRSPLEDLFLPLCERAGLPIPDINVWIEGELVDAVWRERKLVVELDGRNNHSSWAQIQRDRRKELTLRSAGYGVIRYGWAQVEEQPDLVEADLAAQYSASWPAQSA